MLRACLWAALWAGAAFAQEYTIRTIAIDATGAGVAVDARGNVYYPSFFGRTITRIAPDGTRSIYAGRVFGAGFSTGDGGPATDAEFSLVTALAAAPDGSLYVYDDRFVRRIDTRGVITTVVGSGAAEPSTGYASGVPALSLQLHVAASSGIAVDAAGALWLACSGYPALFRVREGIVTVAAAGFVQPNAVAVDARGVATVLDLARLRQVALDGSVRTIAGADEMGFAGDGGPATAARFRFPFGIAADAAGNLFIADTGNDRVRRIDAAGVITTIAGGGSTNDEDYAGPATGAQLAFPKQLAIDAAGNIYVASQHDATIRKLTPVPVPRITAVRHLATGAAGPLSPGCYFEVAGENFDAAARVTVGGIEAPVLERALGRLRAVAPFAVAVGEAVPVVVTANGRASAAVNLAVRPAAPGIFLAFQVESTVTIYGTGAGATTPPYRDGEIVRDAVPLALPVTVTIGGQQAQVLYAGSAPGEVAGMFQINAAIPAGLRGPSAIVVEAGGAVSPPVQVGLR